MCRSISYLTIRLPDILTTSRMNLLMSFLNKLEHVNISNKNFCLSKLTIISR